MIANTSDDLIYEQLGVIINEFEKEALLQGGREGAMIIANSPLTAMDGLLASSDRTLGKVKDSRTVAGSGADTSPTEEFAAADDESNSPAGKKTKNGIQANFDADLQELFGDGESGDYLRDCLDCNLRLTFDWQLKPLNLLGGVEELLVGINKILDSFELQLDPLKSLDGFCDLLNLTKNLCVQDLIIVLLSLKLLIKKYVSDAISIQLDWTVILGPLLKVIVEGIAVLLEQLSGLILAPLDCTLNALYTANELEREGKELTAQVGAISSYSVDQMQDTVNSLQKGQLPSGVELDGTAEDYRWAGSTLGETKYPDAPQFGGFKATERETDRNIKSFSLGEQDSDISLPTGFKLNRGTKLQDALSNVNFAGSTITEKLILPVQEAKSFLEGLLGNILKSLRSVQSLVSGGLGVQMGNLGAIMFLSDMINLVMMLINMLKQFPDVSDWCKQLEQHPEILEEQLNNRFGRTASDIKVENGENNTLLLRKGPQILMEISTCASGRSTEQSRLLDQWIRDLKRKGTE